jgi:methylaspartate mutase sigma subunit
LNGEGEYWCANFRQRLLEMGVGHVLLYAGGNVVVGTRPETEVVALFKGFGFDRVYHQRPDIGAAIVDLFQDLEAWHAPAKTRD